MQSCSTPLNPAQDSHKYCTAMCNAAAHTATHSLTHTNKQTCNRMRMTAVHCWTLLVLARHQPGTAAQTSSCHEHNHQAVVVAKTLQNSCAARCSLTTSGARGRLQVLTKQYHQQHPTLPMVVPTQGQ
jgi:hypothetical protein